MTGTWAVDSAVVVRQRPPRAWARRMPPMHRSARPRESLPASAWHPPVIGASRVCSLVPGSSSTSSTGSGAGCGSEASVNSSSLGPSRVTSCTDSSGTSSSSRPSTYIALPTPRRMMRCTAAEMPSEVLTSRWGRNAIQNLTEARLMTSAASRYALAYTGDCTRDLRDSPFEAYLAPTARSGHGLFKVFCALGSPVGGGARSTAAGAPRISVKIGFSASAQTWYALTVRCRPSLAMPSRN